MLTHTVYRANHRHADLQVARLVATLTATMVTNSGRSAWVVGVAALTVYVIFALTLCLLPPRVQ